MTVLLQNVWCQLEELSITDSTNGKVSKLRTMLKGPLFLRVVKYALDDLKHYNIQAWPGLRQKCAKEVTVDEIFAVLDQLAASKGASNADKQKLFQVACADSQTWAVVKRIVTKDLRCGVSSKLVNKALPGTLHVMPYMRCSSDSKIGNINYPAIVQEKADGVFTNAILSAASADRVFRTRNGKKISQLNKLAQALAPCHGMVLTGELRVRKNGKYLDRKTGNGIINQCIQGTANQADADCVVMCVWDMIPSPLFWEGKHAHPYASRLESLTSLLSMLGSTEYVSLIPTETVQSYEQAASFYASIRKAGGEGAILKNVNAQWKNHTSTDMIKMKNVMDVELRVTGWYKGKPETKYAECLGGITCTSACGKLVVNVGSGFSDEQRMRGGDWLMGQLVQLECESVITSKGKSTASLFLPRFVEVRLDKTEADTLKDLLGR